MSIFRHCRMPIGILAVSLLAAAGSARAEAPTNPAATPIPAGKQSTQIAQARRICCLRGNQRYFTTLLSCRRAGGRAVAQSLCAVDNRRTCCIRGNRRYFTTISQCRRLGGRLAANSSCQATGGCTNVYRPVCGFWRGQRRTYRNVCYARRARATNIRNGACRGGGGGGGGTGSRCYVGNAQVVVSIPGSCTGMSRPINFGARWLRNGERRTVTVNSGTIGQGYPPYGVCNFHTQLVYRCLNGRLRITRVLRCQQAHSGPTAANCSVSQ